jgi:hypothetical protein
MPPALTLAPLSAAPFVKPAAGPSGAPVEWPLPPGFAPAPGERFEAEESCEVLLRSGELRIGRLRGLLPEARQVRLTRRNDTGTDTIAFERIKLLRLPRPVRLAEGAAREAVGDIALVQAADSCTFALLFSDGQVRSGDTTGYLRQNGGLYLYPGANPEQIERWFIPLEAISSFTLGSLTGKLLVEESFVSEAHVN